MSRPVSRWVASTHRNADMLDLFRREWIPGMSPEAFHPGVCCAIEKDDERLDEFCAVPGFRRPIPCPTSIGKSPQEASEGQKTITPKDSSLCARHVRLHME
jgi:hypothetical protein